jgi:hypothetical protein
MSLPRSVQDYEAGLTIPWRHFQRLEEIFKTPMGWFLHGEEQGGGDGLEDRLDRIERVLEELVARLGSPDRRDQAQEG